MQTNNSLYFMIYSDFKRRILDGDLKSGDKIPSEPELEKLYKASRAPIRQAMAMLEQEAYIVRMQGRGTFVSDRMQQSRWLLCSGFSKDMESDFDSLHCKTLWVRMEDPDDEVREALELDDDQQVIHLRRIRYFKTQPVFSIHNYFRDSMNIEAFRRAGDFFLISGVLERLFQITPQRAEEEIQAKLADEETASLMNVEPGFPMLGVKRLYYAAGDRTIFMSRYDVRTDIWTYKASYLAAALTSGAE